VDADSHERVERGARLVGAGILVSRIVGLVRNKVFAHYFSDTGAADAFSAASRIPNVVRNLLGEGTISASFVPLYSAALERGDTRGAQALANALLGVLLAAVSLLTALGVWLAPVLTAVFAGDLAPDTAALVTRLLRVMFPMTGLMVLSGWCLGVQNAHRRFFLAYASAAMWSVAQIALLLSAGPRAPNLAELAWWLSWATLAGALLQIATQAPQVIRLVGSIRPSLNVAASGLSATLKNFVPVVAALGVFQISSLVDLRIASMLPVGAVASLTYANQIYLLPLSLFGVATAAATLPELARRHSRGEGGLTDGVDRALARVVYYTVPSAMAFVAVGDLMAALLYGGGAFGAAQQRTVHFILAGYAVGLSAYASARVLTSTFHAVQDYRTPLRAALVSIVVSAAGALALSLPFREHIEATAGIAAGSALGAFVNVGLLWNATRRRFGAAQHPESRRTLGIALAGAVAAALLSLGVARVAAPWPDQATALIVLPAFGAVYLLVTHRAGLAEAHRITGVLRRRRAGR
jgi:putative peptidoglycan lipid II flippase